MAKRLVVIIVFAAFACEASEKLDAFEINKLIGYGINIGGALDSPKKEGEWGVTLQEEYFQTIKDAGFDSVRLPVRWDTRTPNEPPYTIDPNFLQRVDWAINNCLTQNLPVVLTTHHYDELYSDPDGQRDKFVAIWKQLAERYKDYPDTFVFDPLMEATGNLDADKWNSLLKETIATIRLSNPDRTIVICPAGWHCIDNLHLLELPEDDRNIIVSIFYYTPLEFTHQGASWEKDSEKWLGIKWTGSEDEKQRIAKDFDIAARWGKENNRPIYLNEFGTYEKADMESRVRWTRCVVETAAERDFSLAYWEFCSVFGLYDLQTKSWKRELLEAIVPQNQPVLDPFKVNKLIGRGINIGNALEAPKEGEWGVTIEEEYFDIIKQVGFDSIRLPVCWSAHAPDKEPYTIDPNFFKRIDWAVNNCLSRNIPVIITAHHYNELYDDPESHKTRFLALWQQIAEHYKNYPQTLVFEPLNEPHNNLNAEDWNKFLREAIPLIRQSNPTRTVLIGPANYNDICQLENLELPKNDRNIIVSLHYYMPYEFTHQGAFWVPDSNAWLSLKWTASTTEKNAVTHDLDVAAEWAKRNNRPICVVEFGAYEKADMDSRARWTKFVADSIIEHGLSFTYWDFCYVFGAYDRETKSWRKPLLNALIPAKQ